MKEDDCDPAKLRARAEALLTGQQAHPLMRALWQPRLTQAIDFIAAEGEANRAEGRRAPGGEANGARGLAGARLHGIADRIDRTADGSLAIVDYKTGTPPSGRGGRDGFSLQLGLLGLPAAAGG